MRQDSPSSLVVETEIIDEGSGFKFFAMIPNIVFSLGLSPTSGWIYCKLKWRAGANLKPLPSQEREISKMIGISRTIWNRESKELRHFGLIKIEKTRIVLTDIFQINWKYCSGKLSLQKAKDAVQALGEKGAKDILYGPKLRQPLQKLEESFGPERGQNLGPVRGQILAPNGAANMSKKKNKNMKIISSSVPTNEKAQKKSDDDENKSEFDLQTIRNYVEYLQANGLRKVRNAEGLARAMHKSGEDDGLIAEWMKLKHAVKSDAKPFEVFSRIVALSSDLAKRIRKNGALKSFEHQSWREFYLGNGAIEKNEDYWLMHELAVLRLDNSHLGLPDGSMTAARERFAKIRGLEI